MAKAQIDERTKKVLQEFLPEGYPKEDAVWPLERGGKTICWIAKHKALELMAAKAGMVFEMPVLVENNAKEKTAVIIVRGKLGDATEWSFGEAAPYNNKNEYPFAMAEKRAKDRVILKLLGLHGDVYSEEEADEFKEKKTSIASDITEQDYTPQMQFRDYDDAMAALCNATDLEDVQKFWNDKGRRIANGLKQTNTKLFTQLVAKKDELKQHFEGVK